MRFLFMVWCVCCGRGGRSTNQNVFQPRSRRCGFRALASCILRGWQDRGGLAQPAVPAGPILCLRERRKGGARGNQETSFFLFTRHRTPFIQPPPAVVKSPQYMYQSLSVLGSRHWRYLGRAAVPPSMNVRPLQFQTLCQHALNIMTRRDHNNHHIK